MARVGPEGVPQAPRGTSTIQHDAGLGVRLGDGATLPSGPLDPGYRLPQRLSNREYNQTVQDLLGTSASPASTFVAEEEHGFDHIAEALNATTTQVEGYLQAGETLAAEVFANSALRARLVTCDLGANEVGCARTVVSDFGLRAWRRPLSPEDIDALITLYSDARALGASTDESMEHVVATMLAAPQFLYRTESGDDSMPESQRLDSYELATRLSYFLWSTTPDSHLLELAADDSLQDPAVLIAEADRLLEDARATRFARGFGGQWLKTSSLRSHRVLEEVYPDYDDALAQSMMAESEAFFLELARGQDPITELLLSDAHYVDSRLAQHYGMSGTFSADEMTRVATRNSGRRGVLGMASILTLSSYAHRTSPTLRAKYVMETMLCSEPPPPPPNLMIPDLDGDQAANQAAALDNVRARLELHRSDPLCAGCHAVMDPIGLGLERFDAIGRYRDQYPNGDSIDSSGVLPSGESFDGLVQLSEVLVNDSRFVPCVTETMLRYALGRRHQDADDDQIDLITEHWRAAGLSMRALVHEIVTSSAFRARRVAPTQGANP